MSSDSAQPTIRPMVAPPGGVMTREAGAVTGDVEVWLDPGRPDVVHVRYAGALDEYTVVGKAQGRDIDQVVAVLTSDPGVDEVGNPLSTDLRTTVPETGGSRPEPQEESPEPADVHAGTASTEEAAGRRPGCS